MNEDLIYKFAHKVGLPHWYQTKEVVNFKLLQEFANLIAEHERERCATMCRELSKEMTERASWGANACADLMELKNTP
jgi:hypothetical protein